MVGRRYSYVTHIHRKPLVLMWGMAYTVAMWVVSVGGMSGMTPVQRTAVKFELFN